MIPTKNKRSAAIIAGSAVAVLLVFQSALGPQLNVYLLQQKELQAHPAANDDTSTTTTIGVNTTPTEDIAVPNTTGTAPVIATFNGWDTLLRPPFPPAIRSQRSTALLSPYDPGTNRVVITPQPIPADKLGKHPYLGLMDEQGNFGYVLDPKAHLRNPLPFSIYTPTITSITTNNTHNETSMVCEPPQTPHEWMVYQALQTHLQIATPPSPSSSLTTSSSVPPSRIFCAIYTHAGAVKQTEAIRQTWGKHCDGLFFASTVTNHTTLHVRLKHGSRFEGKYKGIWQRIRSLFGYLYLHQLEDYDYFHICGDDTFVIMENLRSFVSSPLVENWTVSGQPFYGGFWTRWQDDGGLSKYYSHPSVNITEFYYLGGGSGYTLNAKALQLFVEKGALDLCSKNTSEGSEEDLNVAFCFNQVVGLKGFDTRDDQGGHRYHMMSHDQHALFHPNLRAAPKYGMASRIVRSSMEFMKRYYGFPVVWGKDYISPNSVAFHKCNTPDKMKKMEYWLYGTGNEQCSSRR